jgi:hypothetical protein
MIIVPWATLQPTRALAASAQPQAPVVPDEAPRLLTNLWHWLTRHR